MSKRIAAADVKLSPDRHQLGPMLSQDNIRLGAP